MPKRRHEPVRTCVACRQEAGKGELIRVVSRPDGSAAIDLGGHAPGRGAYLHRVPSCVETARKRRNLERSLRAPVPAELWAQIGDLASRG
jgi:predicted RNA-binding protein YlxR (DUF448 family)